MKKRVIFGCFAAVLAVAQEKTTDPRVQQSSNEAVSTVTAVTTTTPSGSPVSYVPSKVKILGALDYGQAGNSVSSSASSQYRAFVFSGYGGESVDVTVTGTDPKAFVAITDSSLIQIASGASHLSARLPYRGPDLEVWYILFKNSGNKPARLSVHVNKIDNGPRKTSSDAVSE